MRKTLALIALIVTLPDAVAASFDCSKASTTVEELVCSDPKLSALDERLASLYRTALASTQDKSTLKDQQRSWIASSRNTCRTAACLQRSYEGRIGQLTSYRPQETTVTGKVTVGSMDSAIELENGDSVSFLTDSAIGKKIFATCKVEDLCAVTGVMDNNEGFSSFSSVSSAKRQHAGASTSQPSAQPAFLNSKITSRAGIDEGGVTVNEYVDLLQKISLLDGSTPRLLGWAHNGNRHVATFKVMRNSLTLTFEHDLSTSSRSEYSVLHPVRVNGQDMHPAHFLAWLASTKGASL